MTPSRPNLDKTLSKYISAHFLAVYIVFLNIKVRYFVNLSVIIKIVLYLVINISREIIKSIVYIANGLFNILIIWRFP